MYIRKIVISIIVLVFILFPIRYTNAVQSEDIFKQQEQDINVDKIQQAIDETIQSDELPHISIHSIIDNIRNGKGIIDIGSIINGMLKILFRELNANITLLIQIIALSVICALLLNIQTSFGDEIVGKVAFIVTYMVIIILLLNSFKLSMEVGKKAIDDMVNFMQALMPTLFAAMVSSGSTISTAAFKPIIVFSVEGISAIIRDYIVPVTFWISVLALVNNLNSRIQIDKFIDFLKQAVTTIIVTLPLIFLGIVTVQGITSPFVDSAAIKTAKFAMGKFVPIVGAVMSDTFDVIMRYAVILKNSVGVIGMLTIVLIVVYPFIKMFTLLIILKLAAAFIQPLADKKIVKGIDGIASSLTLLISCVTIVAVMFFISLAILLATTSFIRV